MDSPFDSPDAGVEFPAAELGTWKNTDSDRCAETVRTALELGYRHVDTAQMYGNESAVGDGIARADIPREDVVVATKARHDSPGYDDVIESAENSRSLLGIDEVSGENHLADNPDSLSLDLSDEDIERIDAIEDEKRISTADRTPW